MMSSNSVFGRRQLVLLLIMIIPACKRELATAPASPDVVAAGGGGPVVEEPLFIYGAMTPLGQGIRVWGVTDAEVTVNGTRIPHCCGDLYSGNLPEAVPTGAKLNLKVVAAGYRTFEAAGIVIEMPVITAPASGSTFAATDPIRLEWTYPTNPDRFSVCLNCIANSNDGETNYALGGAREFVIQPGHLVDWGQGTPVAVYFSMSNFLKPASSDAGISDVSFFAKSRDVIIFIKQ